MKKLLFIAFLLSMPLVACQEDNSGKKDAMAQDSTASHDSTKIKFGTMEFEPGQLPPKPEVSKDVVDDYSYMIGYDLAMGLINEKVKRDYNVFADAVIDRMMRKPLKLNSKQIMDIREKTNAVFEKHYKNLKPEEYIKNPPVIPEDLLKDYSYMLGVDMAISMDPGEIQVNYDQIKTGILDAAANRPYRFSEERRAKMGETYANLMNYYGYAKQLKWQANSKKMEKESNAWFDKMKASGEYVMDKDSFLYKVVVKGKGKQAQADDEVAFHLKSYHFNGDVIDNSYDRVDPIKAPLGQTVKIFTAAISKMTVGSKWIVIAPASMTFGERGMPPDYYPNEPIIFEFELLKIIGKVKAKPQSGPQGGPQPGPRQR